MIRWLPILWFLTLCCAAAAQNTGPASATAVVNPGGLTAAEAQRALEVVQDPEKRARLIETLQAVRLVVTSNAQTREVDRFRRRNAAFVGSSVKLWVPAL